MVCVEEMKPFIALLLVFTKGDSRTFRDFLFVESLEVREGILEFLHFLREFERRKSFFLGLQEPDIVFVDFYSGFDIFLTDAELVPFGESFLYILSELHDGSIIEGDIFSSFS